MNITRTCTIPTVRRTAGLCAVAASLLLAGCSTTPSEGATGSDTHASETVDGSTIALTSNQRLDDGVDQDALFDTARRAMETVLSFEPGPDVSEADAAERARPFLTDELANSKAAQPRSASGLWQMVSDARQQVSTRCYGGNQWVEDAVTMALDMDCTRRIHSATIAYPDNDPTAREYDIRHVRVRVTDTGHGIRVSSYTP